MENDNIVNADTSNGETDDQVVVEENNDELDASALRTKLTETEAKNRQLFERAKKAEGFVLKDGHWTKADKPEPKPDVTVAPKASTGELDETQLDYLDLKGIGESEDIKVIQEVMSKTGKSVRETLKDSYVVAALKDNQAQRDVRAATPSGNKRSGGGQVDGLDLAIAKFEQTGELPADFKLRAAVVDAKYQKESGNKPSWQ